MRRVMRATGSRLPWMARFLALSAVFAVLSQGVRAEDCTRTVGSILSLTGSYGTYGVPISRAAELAVAQVEEARARLGIGCQLAYDVRDSQTQPSVAVDAAQRLIDIEGVTSLVGPISSGITGPLLTSVTVDRGALVIAAASTSPSFTQMARDGETGGLFFRTMVTDSLLATAAARVAHDAGFRNIAILHLNNDWGVNNSGEFARAFRALGGEVANVVPYNAEQASYRSEVNKALEGDPDSLYLAATAQDGAKQLRDWVSFGGPQAYVFPQGLNDPELVAAVGAEVLANGHFISSARRQNESFATVNADLQACCELAIDGGPGRTTGYDAAALLALAHVAADMRGVEPTGANLAGIVREITGPEGTWFSAGVDGFAAGLQMLADGGAVAYEGVTGPIVFDSLGNVSGEVDILQVSGDGFEQVDTVTLEEITEVKMLTEGS